MEKKQFFTNHSIYNEPRKDLASQSAGPRKRFDVGSTISTLHYTKKASHTQHSFGTHTHTHTRTFLLTIIIIITIVR